MRTKFFVAAAALCLAAFTACSDNDVLDPNPGGNSFFNKEGKGYIRLSLDVPVTGATRATTDNNDGNLNEYKVNNAYLLLFTGNSEENAKFSAAYDMTSNFALVSRDEITSTAQIIQEINGAGIEGATDGSMELMAYVMLNKPEAITFENNTIKLTTAVKTYDKASGSSADAASNTAMTYADFTKLVAAAQTNEKIFTSNGFFMGNSPLSDKDDALTNAASAKATTLVKIAANSIYPSRQAAEQGTVSTEVYVERAVAKVELKDLTQAEDTFRVGSTKFRYVIKGWALDNTAKNEYITRNVSGFATYRDYVSTRKGEAGYNIPETSRFIESRKMDGAADFYRINFAEAPTYSYSIPVNAANNYFNRAAAPEAIAKWNTAGNDVAYCFENTFDVAHMKDYQTTRVIVKVELQKENNGNYAAADFYMRNDKGSNIYADEATVKTDLLAEVAGWDFVRVWIKNHNQAETPLTAANFATIKDFVYTNGKVVPELTLAKSGWEAPKGTANAEGLEDLENEINARLAKITVSKYTGGVSYYPVMIRHFNDNETPWKSEWAPLNGKAYEVQENHNAAKDYLGRYGVVRNTWYEINVNSISKIGSAGIPEIPNGDDGNWDDSLERYLSVKIHTVKWQKRSQNVDL